MTAPALALLLLLNRQKPKPPPVAPPVRTYDVGSYAVALDLDTQSGAFTTRTTITLRATAPLTEVELDARDLQIMSAKQGEAEAKVALAPGKPLVVTLATPVAAGESTTIVLTASGHAVEGGDLGLVRAADPEHAGRTIYYTMFEPEGARRVFPCNDRPDDKATSEVTVTVEAGLAVLGQGHRVEDVAVNGDGPARHRVTWKQDKPQSTYLIATVIGPMELAPIADAAVPSNLVVATGEQGRLAFPSEVTRAGLAFYGSVLGTPFPWEKYDQVAIPGFPWGGMENTTATLLRASALVQPTDALARRNALGRLIDHELAHQWFGDDLTPASWKELWLSESFATYLARLAQSDFNKNDSAWIDASLANRQWYFRFEDGPRARPVVSEAVTAEDAFDAAAYQKGAAVLRMLEKVAGRENFRRALAALLKDHAYGSITTDALFSAVSTASGKQLDAFRAAWLTETGYPILKVSRRWLAGEKQLAITVEQRPNRAGGKRRFFPAPLTLVAHRTAEPAFHLDVPLPLDEAKVTIAMPLPAEPEWIDWNQGDVVLARLEANEKPEALDAEARLDPDPMARLWAQLELAGALADPDRKPQSAPSAAALESLARALQSDHSPYVRGALLRELARGTFKKLPAPLDAAVISQLSPRELPDDPSGLAEVRRDAYALLGRVDDPSVPRILAKVMGDKEASADLVEGAALALGHRGDAASVKLLSEALPVQGARGTAYLKSTLAGLCAVEDPSVAPSILEQARAHRYSLELLAAMDGALGDNRALLRSPQGTRLVSQLVADPRFAVEARARFIDLLDEVKTPGAKAELTQLAKLTEPRLAALAKQKLQKNFGAR
jgi:aminopeptidase N